MTSRQTISDAVAKAETDWAAGNYFNAGVDLANVSVELIGPAPTEMVSDVVPASVDVHMVNYIIAGFIFGMTTQNHLTEIEACYTGGATMVQEIMTAIYDFKAGGWNYITQGVLNVLLAALQIPQELHTCKNMQEDLTAIKEWASVFTDKTKLISTVSKHYLLHKKQVTADINQLKADFASEKYFKTGEDLATLSIALLGPIQ